MGKYAKLGAEIRSRRVRLGLNGKQLAQRLNVSPATVTRWERGEDLPRLEHMVELARVLDWDLHDLNALRGAAGTGAAPPRVPRIEHIRDNLSILERVVPTLARDTETATLITEIVEHLDRQTGLLVRLSRRLAAEEQRGRAGPQPPAEPGVAELRQRRRPPRAAGEGRE